MNMFDVLVVLWFISAVAGGVASLAAITAPKNRRGLLLAAAGLFTIAGVLGILSVGVMFLLAAGLCAALGLRAPATPHTG